MALIHTWPLVLWAALACPFGPLAFVRSAIVDRLADGAHPSSLPAVIWHGLGDSYNNNGILDLAQSIQDQYPGKSVYLIRLDQSGESDRRATWFGSANQEVQSVCDQLSTIPELSNGFDAIGFSQGGQFLRAYVERCNRPRVRNLITLGSQHMGVSGYPPCQGFLDVSCHIVQKLIEAGSVYGSYAQHHIIPAQYFRDQANILPYLKHNEFLRDINNERLNDTQPDLGFPSYRVDDDDDELYKPRNLTYKLNFESLKNFVMFEFSKEHVVSPSTSAFFTLPDRNSNPVPLQELPIYAEDYIGLKTLDLSGRIHYGTCEGGHMRIDETCWTEVMNWLKDDDDSRSGSSSQLIADSEQQVFS